MKKVLITLVVVGLLLIGLVGCDSVDTGKVTPLPEGKPAENMTWLSPGKVLVSNFYPGARAECPITVHNGNDYESSFKISYRLPDNVGEGYSKPVLEVQDWVMVVDPTPVLMPRETRDILVVLEMPKNAVVFAEKWEFWISVKDTTQTGMVRTEICSRWLISMR